MPASYSTWLALNFLGSTTIYLICVVDEWQRLQRRHYQRCHPLHPVGLGSEKPQLHCGTLGTSRKPGNGGPWGLQSVRSPLFFISTSPLSLHHSPALRAAQPAPLPRAPRFCQRHQSTARSTRISARGLHHNQRGAPLRARGNFVQRLSLLEQQLTPLQSSKSPRFHFKPSNSSPSTEAFPLRLILCWDSTPTATLNAKTWVVCYWEEGVEENTQSKGKNRSSRSTRLISSTVSSTQFCSLSNLRPARNGRNTVFRRRSKTP